MVAYLSYSISSAIYRYEIRVTAGSLAGDGPEEMDIRATHLHAPTTGVDRTRLPPKGLTDAQIQENKQKERADFFAKTHQKEAEEYQKTALL